MALKGTVQQWHGKENLGEGRALHSEEFDQHRIDQHRIAKAKFCEVQQRNSSDSAVTQGHGSTRPHVATQWQRLELICQGEDSRRKAMALSRVEEPRFAKEMHGTEWRSYGTANHNSA